ncbi:membrane protein TE20 [Testudinid alphaherpesvirus 3]|nr:membrane protein TE20 [Testudinid alphaherpesvirus 3]AKI81645.1 membrane protein TE20 [Testudinid alphaherpesvirus 3]AKI81748.1 membrane protein TE20 [Testudinid alphaherpesvirus 3]
MFTWLWLVTLIGMVSSEPSILLDFQKIITKQDVSAVCTVTGGGDGTIKWKMNDQPISTHQESFALDVRISEFHAPFPKGQSPKTIQLTCLFCKQTEEPCLNVSSVARVVPVPSISILLDETAQLAICDLSMAHSPLLTIQWHVNDRPVIRLTPSSHEVVILPSGEMTHRLTSYLPFIRRYTDDTRGDLYRCSTSDYVKYPLSAMVSRVNFRFGGISFHGVFVTITTLLGISILCTAMLCCIFGSTKRRNDMPNRIYGPSCY